MHCRRLYRQVPTLSPKLCRYRWEGSTSQDNTERSRQWEAESHSSCVPWCLRQHLPARDFTAQCPSSQCQGQHSWLTSLLSHPANSSPAAEQLRAQQRSWHRQKWGAQLALQISGEFNHSGTAQKLHCSIGCDLHHRTEQERATGVPWVPSCK